LCTYSLDSEEREPCEEPSTSRNERIGSEVTIPIYADKGHFEMDHLPVPKTPVHEPVVVRLRKTEEYHGPFEDFLARHGWDLPRFRDASLVRTHLDELLELLQRWLYFGLLEECLGCSGASA
jgi:hypothetical protein